ncbi:MULTISPECIES: hypothetical protein [Serratia]|uniref:hypothetical protein n=1 Tax=Serratia TaxID=613 RepID=UPI00055C1B38|nr:MULTISPECIES: hypothetical protein [Serratia]NYA45623.1 hypothetical protein [Serratia fonticola]UAN53318.1 hypothetical protein KGP26_09805 [Serratia sp. JSRIV002]CAI0755741.1 Uncharacterised protein [Serratia fonticola]CAI1121003.1 Uncharacterised protein [Serratia fonticola]
MKMSFLAYLFLVLTSFFFCEHLSAASTGTLTVKFGQTTEDTFKITHPEAVNVGFNSELKGNIYKETPDNNKDKRSDIVFESTKDVFVLFDENKNLAALHLQLKTDQFSVISAILAKKYTTAVKKTSFIGSDYMELYNAGVLIYLMDPFFFSNTSLFFIRTDVRNKILKNIPTNLLDDELKVLNYLVEKSFQSTK